MKENGASTSIELDTFMCRRACGLITADRPWLTPAENRARTSAMAYEPRFGLGLLIIEAQKRKRFQSGDHDELELTLLLVGPEGDDHGRVKGVLRSWGMRYGQDIALRRAPNSDEFEPWWLQAKARRNNGMLLPSSSLSSQMGTLNDFLRGPAHDPGPRAINFCRSIGFFTRRPAPC